jgi:hypothetical protein
MNTGAGPQGLNGLGKVKWDPVGEEAGWGWTGWVHGCRIPFYIYIGQH